MFSKLRCSTREWVSKKPKTSCVLRPVSPAAQLKSGTTTRGNTQRDTAPSSSSFPSTRRSWSGGSRTSTRLSWCKLTPVRVLVQPMCRLASSAQDARERVQPSRGTHTLCAFNFEGQSRKIQITPTGKMMVAARDSPLVGPPLSGEPTSRVIL